METSTYISKSYSVEVARVTPDNFQDVAEWAGGEIKTDSSGKTPKNYIQIEVKNPLNEKQTHAFVGDWVLKGRNGFKVYTDRAFKSNFDKEEDMTIGRPFGERKNLISEPPVDSHLARLGRNLGVPIDDDDERDSEPVSQNVFDKADDSAAVQTFVSEKDAIAGKR